MSDFNRGKHFVRINGKVLGPFEMEQLRSLKDRGRLLAEHEISADRRQWESAGRVAALFAQPEVQSAPASSVSSNVGIAETEAPEVAKEWFYTVDGEQLGPVSTKKLRKMITNGKLRSDDLVWRDGMSEWHSAEDQDELQSAFENGSARNPRFSKSASHSTIRKSPTVLWDSFLEIVRDQITVDGLDQSFQRLVQIGGFSMLIGMLAAFVFLITLAVKEDSLQLVLFSLVTIVAISVLRYAAMHLSLAGDMLIKSTPNNLSSPAFVNVVSVILLFVGIISAAICIYQGLVEEELSQKAFYFNGTVQSLLVFGFAAYASLHPQWLNLQIISGARAGQEGIAVMSFFFKLLMRLASLCFAVSAVLGAVGFVSGTFCLFLGDDWKIASVAWLTVGARQTIVAGLVPLCFYLLMVWFSIFLDVAQAIILSPQNSKD